MENNLTAKLEIPFCLYRPLHPARITQGFGQNLVPFYKELGIPGHNGIDFVRPEDTDGANVRAMHSGIVIATGIDGSGGYAVHVRTRERWSDIEGNPQYWQSVYYHLYPDIRVRPGQNVAIGCILGRADNSGKYTTGTHLHIGLKRVAPLADGRWKQLDQNNGYFGAVDPLPYLQIVTAYEFKRKYLDPVWNLVAAFQRQ